jgi:hypothetical protein
MKSLTSILHLADQTVFTSKEIALLWRESNPDNLKNKINYYVKSGVLKSLRRGIYTLMDKTYPVFEVANRIYSPSYVSLETVLAMEGIIFQYDSSVYSISYQTREQIVENQKYCYRKINTEILTNPMGLNNMGSYWIATTERAFLDSLYLNGQPHFDHLDNIDWRKCREILPIYHNQSLNKRFETYAKQ